MVLDLRPFDIVEGVGFDELFILVTNPFPNPNSFRYPDKFENLEIFWYPSRSQRNFVFPTRRDILGSRTPLLSTRVKNDSGTVGGGLNNLCSRKRKREREREKENHSREKNGSADGNRSSFFSFPFAPRLNAYRFVQQEIIGRGLILSRNKGKE